VAIDSALVVECRRDPMTGEPARCMSPHETVAAFLRARFRTTLRGGELGLDQPLLSSGIVDSFGVLELVAFLEDTFCVTIAPSRLEMTELETVHRIVALVERLRREADRE
jgi:acyl carrier protein